VKFTSNFSVSLYDLSYFTALRSVCPLFSHLYPVDACIRSLDLWKSNVRGIYCTCNTCII